MPEISRFYGIVIYMFYDDHNPPHFHVKYNDHTAIFEIESGELLSGEIPNRQMKYIQVWADIHKLELLHNFEALGFEEKNYKKISPLK